jgi:hypothetical protein
VEEEATHLIMAVKQKGERRGARFSVSLSRAHPVGPEYFN